MNWKSNCDPHHSWCLGLHGIQWYRLPGSAVLTYQVRTIQRTFQRVRVPNNCYFLRQDPGSSVWLRIDLVPLENGSRGWVMGQEEERNSFLDRRLNVDLINVILIIEIEHPHNTFTQKQQTSRPSAKYVYKWSGTYMKRRITVTKADKLDLRSTMWNQKYFPVSVLALCILPVMLQPFL